MRSLPDSCITGPLRHVVMAFSLQPLNEPTDQIGAGPLPEPPLEDYCSGTSCSIRTKSATYLLPSHRNRGLIGNLLYLPLNTVHTLFIQL